MRFDSVLVVVLAAISLLSSGCAEHLPLPPTPADIARINEAAREENGYLRIEYVEPIPPERARIVRPSAIESFDDGYVSFRTAAGDLGVVRLDRIRGVTVKDRGRGALIGAGIGLVAVAAGLAGFWLLTDRGYGPGICSQPCPVSGIILPFAIAGAYGATIGVWISGRRTYLFGPGR
jgi:hypothetical protein